MFFNFGKADVNEMVMQLSADDWSDFLGGDCVDEYVQNFYGDIYCMIQNTSLTMLIITKPRHTNT
jgi:hypothetical protein